MVIDALITTRILIQFMGQIVAVALLRRDRPDLERPFRIWLYPLPNLVALAGWVFVFSTSGATVILFGLVTLLAGLAAFGCGRGRRRNGPSRWRVPTLKVQDPGLIRQTRRNLQCVTRRA